MGLLVRLGLRRSSNFDCPTLIDQLLSSPLILIASLLYRILLLLRGKPFNPPRDKPPIRVVCISDTHSHPVYVPPGDILIHAGDLANYGSAAEIQVQLDWLKSLPHGVKIVVAGNHDSFFDIRSRSFEDVASHAELNLDGITYLEGRLVVPEIKGRRIAIFGAPDIPEIGPRNFAFQYTPLNQPWLSKVPPQTDILKYHRDVDLGCPHLLREVWRVRPRLHVFGHIHCGYGSEPVFFDDMQLAYECLLSRPRCGLFWSLIPSQAWLDFLAMVFHGLHSLLWKWLMQGPGTNNSSLMVNAAQMYKNTGRVYGRAIVVDI